MVIAHFQYLVMPDCNQCVESIAPMISLEIGYSIYCAVLWSAVPYTVPDYAVVTAFGITSSFLNLSLAISPIVIGCIDSYKFISLFFTAVGVLTVLTGTWLHLRSNQKDYSLNITECAKEVLAKEECEESIEESTEDSALVKKSQYDR